MDKINFKNATNGVVDIIAVIQENDEIKATPF